MGWAGTWIGRVWKWMSASDIFIHGGTSLDLACMGDRSLTDIVRGKKNRCFRVGSMRYDLSNLAQVTSGWANIQARSNKHEDSAEREGLSWSTHIRRTLGTGSTMVELRPEHALKGKRCVSVWFHLGKY